MYGKIQENRVFQTYTLYLHTLFCIRNLSARVALQKFLKIPDFFQVKNVSYEFLIPVKIDKNSLKSREKRKTVSQAKKSTSVQRNIAKKLWVGRSAKVFFWINYFWSQTVISHILNLFQYYSHTHKTHNSTFVFRPLP